MTTESKFDCVFCKEVFDDKESLLVHFRKHGDPNFNTKNKGRQQNEMPSNEKTAEESELVGCDVCEEVFPTISKAITHKHKAHPDHDTKYFCPFCGKLFTMKHLYNKHLQSNHESCEGSDSNDFHCDCCDVTFHVPSAMLYHNKFFHRQDTELPAFGQSKKVKTYYQELLQIYYCAFCGEEYNNKVNLHKHMSDDHGDENQCPTEILRCPLCEAIFYHLDAYEIHLTFHSTEDLYSEQNEMKEQVTEFSLETVSPIIEKVEEEVDEEDRVKTEGIDSFLQLVMGESADNDVPDKTKSKKHKKHKKSKKAAITLDEFLNMNKDVFGDGLDVQGIEEVPTQVVLKKVKGKKIPNKPESKMVNANLAKLKKHGIVVKTKSGNNPVMTNLKKVVNKPSVISTPNEILSKLMNQGNSQIKIFKKSVSQNINMKDGTPKETTQPVDEIIDSMNKEATSDYEEEKSDNLTKTDIPTVDSNTISNSNMFGNLEESENTKQSDPNLLSVDDNAFENKGNCEANKIDIDTKSETKSSCVSESNLPSSVLEQKIGNNSNIDLPDDNQLSKTCQNTKQDLSSICKVDIDPISTDNNDKKQTENTITNTTLNALKHLSHLITIKPVNQTKTSNVSCKSNETFNNESKSLETAKDNNEADLTTQSPEKKLILNKSLAEHVKLVKQSPLPNYNSDSESKNDEFNDNSAKDLNTELDTADESANSNKGVFEVKKLKVKNLPYQEKVIPKNQIINNQPQDKEIKEKCSKKANLDILKRLTNVTAKPISVSNSNPASNIKQDKNKQVKNPLQNITCKPNINEEIEIFNIDDSDSEGSESESTKNATEDKVPSVPVNALKNLGKNIIVKSNQQNVFTSEVKEKKVDIKIRPDTRSENIKMNKQTQDIQRSINLQNKLKNLSENITVKSRNSSPNMYNKELYKSFGDYDDDDDKNDSDSESTGKVKITEVNENEDSENECNESLSNAIVESPHASNSDHEDNEDIEDDLSDFENQIKTNTVKKDTAVTTLQKNICLESIKNLNKELTIKSLNSKKYDAEGDVNLNQKEGAEDVSNVNKKLVPKSVKANPLQNEQSMSSQQASGSMSQGSFNKKVSASNQVNTVKTVKRFQSQTVIEEITTTVTKTIRTVNQSTNEVVQNRCNIKPTIRPQKILNKQPGRELQGTTVRHASPTIGTKIRNATNIVRNVNPTIVRPSNQLVPVRPVLNLPRTSDPSMSAIRKIAPPKASPSQKPAIGKLKISAHALNQATKRPSDETPGHFSCFKKPKDSLVNSTDMVDCKDDSATHFSSSNQSRTDFSCVSKTIKGKGTVTATQTRTEVSTSSKQQLSRLSNVSGLKIIKTSSKQATQVDEKCEINTATKDTLEALEKLQKHGLLIKKPRIDDNNERPNSFSGSDDEINEQ